MMRYKLRKLRARLFGLKHVQETDEFRMVTATWRGDTYIISFERFEPAVIDPDTVQLESNTE